MQLPSWSGNIYPHFHPCYHLSTKATRLASGPSNSVSKWRSVPVMTAAVADIVTAAAVEVGHTLCSLDTTPQRVVIVVYHRQNRSKERKSLVYDRRTLIIPTFSPIKIPYKQ